MDLMQATYRHRYRGKSSAWFRDARAGSSPVVDELAAHLPISRGLGQALAGGALTDSIPAWHSRYTMTLA